MDFYAAICAIITTAFIYFVTEILIIFLRTRNWIQPTLGPREPKRTPTLKKRPTTFQKTPAFESVFYITNAEEGLSPRKWGSISPLKNYLRKKLPYRLQGKEPLNLRKISICVRNIIFLEELYDPRNPRIILCDDALEVALNRKALHIDELDDVIITQLDDTHKTQTTHPDTLQSDPCYELSPGARRLWHDTWARFIPPPGVPQGKIPHEMTFKIQPALLNVIRTLDGVDKTKEQFTWIDITKLVTRYLLSNKNRFFDSRNIRIALLEGDLLGIALGNIKAIHRSQILDYLKSVLIAVNRNDHQPPTDSPKNME